MLRRCFVEGQIRQALGIAIEAHRIDFVKEAIEREGKFCSIFFFLLHTTFILFHEV